MTRTTMGMIQKDAVYINIFEACMKRLADHGAFEKEDVLAAAQVFVGREEIRWDMIVKLLVRTLPGLRLVGVRANYFLPKKASTALHVALLNDINADPRRYYARGHKEANGYVTCSNTKVQALISYYIKRLRNVGDGVHRRAADVEEIMLTAAADELDATRD